MTKPPVIQVLEAIHFHIESSKVGILLELVISLSTTILAYFT